MATVKGTGAADFIHRAGDGNVPLPGFNEVVGVTTGDDTIDGRAGDDIIYGDGGNDTITGGLGTDTLYGGDGDDRFVVSSIAEINGLAEFMDGGAGTNQLRLDGLEGTVDISNATLANMGTLILSPIGSGLTVSLSAEQLSAFSSFSGNPGRAGLALSSAGAVALSNGFFMNGVDSITGSSGNDTFDIEGSIISPLVIAGGAGNDSIALHSLSNDAKTTSYSLDGGEGDDELKLTTGIGTLTGGKGKDELFGGKRADGLFGNAGKDELTGRGHQDMLTGGESADSFIYQKLKDSLPEADRHDIITDFSHDQGDRIDLHKIDADLTVAGDQAFFLAGSAFTGTPGELIQFAQFGATIVQGDVDGNGVADIEIALDNAPVLVAADFIF